MSSNEGTPAYPTPSFTPPLGEEASSSSSPSRPLASPSKLRADGTQYDERELEVFRREWQAEVQRRRAEPASPQAGPSSLPPLRIPTTTAKGKDKHREKPRLPKVNGNNEEDHTLATPDLSSDEEAQPHSPSRTRHLLQLAEDQRRAALQEAEEQGAILPPQIRSPPRQKLNQEAPANASASKKSQMKAAVQAYALGAEMERKGQFDQATHHYRRAFRLDSAPDKLYERAKSLLRQDGSKSVGASWDAQSDALLASSEVGDMIRRATDFDDSRVIAIAKREQEEGSKAVADAKMPPTGKQSDAIAPAEDDGGPPALEEDDQLEAIIARSSTAVEGRDLSQISFTGRPSPIKLSQRHKAPEADADVAVNDVAEKLDKARLNGEEGGEGPPPLIARLPDEILAYICRLVVEPRGQRGTRIRPPRVEGVQDKHGNQIAAAKGEEKASNDKEKAPPSGNDSTAARATKGPAGVGVILAGADWQSLEMLARVSWKWRLASRIKGIWRLIISETYHAPQLALPLPLPSLTNPRLLFIHHPRIRETGCYIAACHYSRPGLSVDNPWVRVFHTVEFYRSIRFMPDGKALTFLTTDPPRDTVGRMYAGNGDKGFAVGRWRVEMSDGDEGPQRGSLGEELDGEKEKRRRRGGARVIIEDLKDRNMAKYAFRIVLSLRSTSRGKWNKMEMLEYCSINLATGEVLPLPQKHDRPFHFSTVRSYGV